MAKTNHKATLSSFPLSSFFRFPASRRSASYFFFLAATLVLSLGNTAQATQQSWSGATSTTFSNSQNWSTGSAPANSLTQDTALFDLATYTNQPTVNLATSVAGLVFGDGTTSTGALTLTESATLTIGGTGITMNANSGAVTLAGNTNFGIAQSWTNNSSSLLTIGATTNTISNGASSTPLTLTFAGSGSGGITVNGVIANGTGTSITNVVINMASGTVATFSNSTYTGTTTITSGTLTANGGNGLSLGVGSAVTMANSASAVLNLNQNLSIGSLTGGGASGGNVTLGVRSLTVGTDGTSPSAYAGSISGTGGLTKTGTGTLTLTGANTYSGATTATVGTLALTFSGSGTNIINSISNSSALSLSGGNLTINGGGSSATNSQRFNGTSTTANTASTVVLVQNGASSLSLSLGSLTHGTQSTLDITLPTTGTVTTGSTTSATNSILTSGGSVNTGVAYATANGGTTWATNVSGTIGALSSYSTGTPNYTSTNNVDVTNGDTLGAGVTVNTLRFNAATDALTLTGTNTVNTGGILVTPTSTNASITGGTLQGGTSGKELVIIDNGALNIGSNIVNNSTASAVTSSGTGTTVLSGSNSYTGGTAILSGTLQAGSTSAFGSNSIVTVANKAGATLNLNGYNNSIGALAGGGNFGGSITLSGGGTLTVGALNSASSFGGNISGTGGITQTGTGSLTLSGSNSYTGATTINSGTVTVGSATGLGVNSAVILANNATATLDGLAANNNWSIGSLSGGGSLGGNIFLYFGAGDSMTVGGDNTSTTYAGVINGKGNAVTKVGNGTLTLTGTSTYSGTTTISGGTLQIGSGGTIGALSNTGPAGITVNGSTIADNSALVFDRSNTVAQGTDFSSNAISGTGTVTQAGSGTLVLSSGNSYTGGTIINSGTVATSVSNSLGTSSNALTLNSGTLDITSGTFTNTHAISVTSSGGTIQADTTANTFSNTGTVALAGNLAVQGSGNVALTTGVISGVGGITKSGTGTLVLNGANTFSGGVTVNSGVVSVGTVAASGTAQSLGQGALVTLAGASSTAQGILLYTGGTGTFGENVTVTTGDYGMIANTGGGVLTLSGTLTKDGSVLTLEGGKFVITSPILGPSANSDIILGGTTYPGSATVGLTSSSTYVGPTFITDGSTLLTGVSNALPTTPPSNLTLGASTDTSSQTNTLDLLGNAETVASLNTVGPATNQVISSNGSATTPAIGTSGSTSTGSLIVNYTGALSDTFNGLLGGSGGLNNFSLVKTGTGTLVLSGSNTYGGGTNISAGTLTAANTIALGAASSAIKMTGGTLDLETSSSIGAYTVNVATNATIDVGKSSTGISAFTQSLGALNIGAFTLTVNVGNNYTSGTPILDFIGSTTLSSATSATTVLNPTSAELMLTGVTSTVATGNVDTLDLDGTFFGEITGSIVNGTGGGAVAVEETNANSAWLLMGPSNYTGGTTLYAGTLGVGNTIGLGAVSSLVTLNGGILDIATSSSINAYNVVVGGNTQINSDLLTAGAGIVDNLGTLSIGGNILTVAAGPNVTSGAPGITFSNTTLNSTSGAASVFNPTTALLSLNAVAGSATTGNTDTLDLDGTGTGTVTTIGNGGGGGTVALVKTNSSRWFVTGPANFTGGTIIQAGTLVAANVYALGSAPGSSVTMSGGTLDLATDTSANSYNVTINGNATIDSDKATTASAGINHALGTLSIVGGATLTGAAGPNVSGSAAGLSFTSATLTSTTSSVSVLNPTTAGMNLNVGPVTSMATTGNVDTLDLDGTFAANKITGVISDGTGGGALALSKTNSSNWFISGANTYTGGTFVSAGTLTVAGSGTLGSTSGKLIVNGGTVNLNSTSQTVAVLNGTGGTILNNASGSTSTLTVGTGGNYAGVIADNSTGTGTVALVKSGSAVLGLSGTNTYSGATTVNGGVLLLSSTNTLTHTSSVTVNTGGTLLFGASSAINSSAAVNLAGTVSVSGTSISNTMGALTLTGASIIDFGSGNGNTLTFASLSGLSATNTLTIYNWTGSVYPPTATTDTGGPTQDRLLFSTDPGLTGSPLLADITFYSDSGTTLLGNGLDLTSGYLGTPELVPVPEPSTIFGSLFLLVLLAWRHRRQIRALLILSQSLRD